MCPQNISSRYNANKLIVRGKKENEVEDSIRKLKITIDDLKSVTFKLDHGIVGFVIGKKGTTINKITKLSSADVLCSKDGEITIQGTSENVKIAKDMIDEIVEANYSETLKIPQDYLGTFIGKKGVTLNAFRKEFNVEVNIPFVRDKKKSTIVATLVEVTIRGDRAKVGIASKEIKERVEKYKSEHRSICVHRNCISTLIGQKGETIKKLQKELNVVMETNFESFVVSIRGPEDVLDKAESRIIEIVGKNAVWKPDEGESPVSEYVLKIPTKLMRHVIGAKGSTLKRIENEYDVIVMNDQRRRRKKSSRGERGEEKEEEESVTIISKKSSNVESAKEAIESILDDAETFKKLIKVKRTPFAAVFGVKFAGLRNIRNISSSLNFGVKECSENNSFLNVTVEGTRKGFQIACDAIEAANRRKSTTFVRLIRDHLPSLKSSERNLAKISSDTKCSVKIDDRT